MDFLLATVLWAGIFVGYNAQPAGNLNFACRNGEEYHMCRAPCEPTCISIRSGIKVKCIQSCVAGCFCRDGLVRASDKTCVLPEECTTRTAPKCKENEEFMECGSPCVVNCSNINDPIFCTKPCHSGCFCKPDFVRDSKGNCVHPRNCNIAGYGQCPVNEHYVNCVNFCNTCWESDDCITHYCTPGCDCKPGFHRNVYGQCITIEECFTSLYDSSYPELSRNCGENEIYSYCVSLCNDCMSRGKCNFEFCEPGCDCRPGYFRDERGVCVPEHFCYRRCSEDQIFSRCGPSCISTCENYMRLLYHPCKQECVPGCFCPRNYVVGPDGRCIQPKFCPAERPICLADEQYYVCIPTCRATCDSYNDSSAVCDTKCTKGCFCKGGLLRRRDGKCVPPRDCPERIPTCPPGEAFYQCLPTCRSTCETLNTSRRICSTECKPGCFCQPSFVRNKEGKCVRPEECPVPVRPMCPPGEVHYDCVPTCRNTCDNWNLSRSCIKTCRPGCYCRRGFVRNRAGKCVRTRNCPIVCRMNEEFLSCGSPCPVTCRNFRKRPVCTEQCTRGCFCKLGFVLGPSGRCIRPQQCPVSSTTPERVSFDPRRGETEDEDSDETKTTPSLSTESNQTATNKLTDNDTSEASSSVPDSTMLITSAATNQAASAATKSAFGKTSVTTTPETATHKSDNPPQAESTTTKGFATIPSENITATVTTPVTNTMESSKMASDGGQIMTTDSEVVSTENATSVMSTPEP